MANDDGMGFEHAELSVTERNLVDNTKDQFES